ncbi:hypothetical protein DS2_03395 [Catenovulum agarivorans DS-2]|uniref:Uncharacterized protein n=1 Tax=Catenovulum agarivorans DS-2 TaxID=1328313 RepID=W7QI08_9ALTE|nr:YjgN family protein [Catenovulum agarivorans]EWH11521.1 hypothetical protein DS2_03395 [Catenovulum agarivorans DS-2]
MENHNTDASSQDEAILTTTHFQFTGKAGEFFRIWIVNFALTIVTLGIYSAWAKVRQQQYFYGNTLFGGKPFQYLATPMQILIGRLITAGLLIAFFLLNYLQSPAAGFLILAFVLAMPALFVSSLRFNYRNTAHRNVKFAFTGSIAQGYWYFLILPVLCSLPLFLFMPYAIRQQRAFIVNHIKWGDKEFTCEPPIKNYYILFLSMYVAMGVMVGGMFAVTKSLGAGGQPDMTNPAFVLVFLMMYLAMFYIGIAVKAYLFKWSLQYSKLAGHQVITQLKPSRYVFVAVTNFLAIGLTLGLMLPWAKIRMARFLLETSALEAPANFISEVEATHQKENSAIGQEVADGLDVEIGFGL